MTQPHFVPRHTTYKEIVNRFIAVLCNEFLHDNKTANPNPDQPINQTAISKQGPFTSFSSSSLFFSPLPSNTASHGAVKRVCFCVCFCVCVCLCLCVCVCVCAFCAASPSISHALLSRPLSTSTSPPPPCLPHLNSFMQSLARFVLGQDGRERGQSAQVRQLHQENVQRANQLSDERVETKRRMRLMAEMQHEEEMARKIEMVGFVRNSNEEGGS